MTSPHLANPLNLLTRRNRKSQTSHQQLSNILLGLRVSYVVNFKVLLASSHQDINKLYCNF